MKVVPKEISHDFGYLQLIWEFTSLALIKYYTIKLEEIMGGGKYSNHFKVSWEAILCSNRTWLKLGLLA